MMQEKGHGTAPLLHSLGRPLYMVHGDHTYTTTISSISINDPCTYLDKEIWVWSKNILTDTILG